MQTVGSNFWAVFQFRILNNFDEMVEISFLNLLKEKRFGEVKLGDPKSKVIKLLGEPDGYSNPEFNPKYYDAILYDRFEFNFRNNRLNSISNNYILNWTTTWRFNSKFHYHNESFKLVSWFTRTWVDTKLENFKIFLQKNKIPFIEEAFLDSIKLELGKDLELFFSSKLSHNKQTHEWQEFSADKLNMRFSSFNLYSK